MEAEFARGPIYRSDELATRLVDGKSHNTN